MISAELCKRIVAGNTLSTAVAIDRRVSVYYGAVPSSHRPEWAAEETGWVSCCVDYWVYADGSRRHAHTEYAGMGFDGDPRGRKLSNRSSAVKQAAARYEVPADEVSVDK